ncbi:MAG TPA: RNA polymerase sigma factor [Terriglobales bacterium]|nr:RNA polymerase sigma factor [Terriglobales bacterium]
MRPALDVDAWFEREILPLEAALMQYLQHNWRNKSDIADLRQDIYVQVYEAARKDLPDSPKAFLFASARHLLIRRMRREQIVPFEAVADFDALGAMAEVPGPESHTIARDELRRLQAALDRLPPRTREAFVMRRVDGLSHREIAARMVITERTVKFHLAEAGTMLADILFGEHPDIRKSP